MHLHLLVGVALVITVTVVLLRQVPAHAQSACPGDDGWTRLVAPEPGWEPPDTVFINQLQPGTLSLAAGWEARGTIYAGGSYALYRTQDCAATWDVVWTAGRFYAGIAQGTPVYPIQLLRAAPGGRLFLGTGSFSQPLLASDSYGASMRETLRGIWPIQLEVAPSDPDVAYLFVWYGGGNRFPERRIRRTTDGGMTWQQLPSDMPAGTPVIDSSDSSTVYLLHNARMARSTDGAESFSPYAVVVDSYAASETDRTRGGTATMNADGSRRWYIDENSGHFYRGLHRGTSWERMIDPPVAVPIGRLSASPHDPGVLFALTSTGELWAYREPAEASPSQDATP